MNRGLFIVLEGQNGSGKTTIINKLTEYLNGPTIYVNNEKKLWNVYKFPNRETIIGKKIDKFLKKEIKFESIETSLKFFSDNRREFQKEMIELINNGYNIICDRYIYSSFAYTMTSQTIDIINQKKIEILGIENILKYDIGLLKPDHVFLIQGDLLKLRSEKPQLYHISGSFGDILFNNYIISFMYTKTNFSIIQNEEGKL